jgi:hypothetical protein
MTVSNHVAAVVAIVVGAYAAHLLWPDIRNSLIALAKKPIVEATDLEFWQELCVKLGDGV